MKTIEQADVHFLNLIHALAKKYNVDYDIDFDARNVDFKTDSERVQTQLAHEVEKIFLSLYSK